jgi:hypothetical protein
VDADTGEIAAHILTTGNADDAAQATNLFGQAKGCIATVTADGAYDSDAVYQQPPGSMAHHRTWSSRHAAVQCRAPTTLLPRSRGIATSSWLPNKAAWRGSGRRDTAGTVTGLSQSCCT